MTTGQMVKLAALIIILSLSLLSDIRQFKIKNRITVPAFLAGLVLSIAISGFQGLLDSLAGALIPLILLFILYALRMLGAGDVKLFAAIGAIMGTGFIINCMVYSFLFGGFLGVIIIAFRKNAKERFGRLITYIKSCILTMRLLEYQDFQKDKNGLFRFSYAIAGGTVITLLFFFLDLRPMSFQWFNLLIASPH